MTDSIHFTRLNLTILPTHTIENRWALFAQSGLIECSQNGRLLRCVVSLYGDADLVAVERFDGVAWDEIEHRVLTWFRDRPHLAGWLAEMQMLEEVAA